MLVKNCIICGKKIVLNDSLSINLCSECLKQMKLSNNETIEDRNDQIRKRSDYFGITNMNETMPKK